MTGSEFLLNKIKETIINLSDDNFTFDVVPFSQITWEIVVRGRNRYSQTFRFRPKDEGIDLERLERSFLENNTSEKEKELTLSIVDKINKAVAFPRFYLKKGLSIASLRGIYEDAPTKEVKEKKPLIPEGKDIQGYPDKIETVTKCVRIKIKEHRSWSFDTYRVVIVGGVSKDKTRFNISSVITAGVQHSSELTFLNQKDAQEFMDNNKEFFSQFNPEDISFVKSQRYTLYKIPIPGSDKAYATSQYLEWRRDNGKPLPTTLTSF